jgi:hypothetical protein
MKYRKGYKYQLAEDISVQTQIIGIRDIVIDDFIILDSKGLLTVKKGYAWDGASGPTIDTLSSMRGSLLHDALYQLMREKLLSIMWFDTANRLLRDTCIEDGMWKWRANLWYNIVGDFAKYAATKEEYPIIIAP